MSKRVGVIKPLPLLDKLLDAAVEIRQAPDAAERAYMARQLVQCTLPHSDPGDVPLWQRRNGALALTISPFRDRTTLKALYPYGSIPRLLLFWLVTEATQKKSRRIHLGHSLDAFMRQIGLDPLTGGGPRGDAKRLHNQMDRLFRCTISFEDSRPEHDGTYLDMLIAPQRMTFWDPARSQQDSLFESWIEIGEQFYNAVTAAPVPVDMRALRALKRSPLALDLYAWATYSAFGAHQKGSDREVPWAALHAQIGGEYTRLRTFREKAGAALKKVASVYPALRYTSTPDSLIVHPSAPAVAPRRLKA